MLSQNNQWKSLISAVLLGLGLSATQAQAQTLCVFDVGGASGDYYAFMKDYALAAQKWSVEVILKPYNQEDKAINDYKQGKCDAVSATSFATREFNKFTGTINAVGAVPSNAVARNLLLLMGNPKLAPEMVENNNEVLGLMPIGSAYFIVKNRGTNDINDVQGKRVAVLANDPVQQRMLQKVGGTPALMTVDTAFLKVQDPAVDVVPLPSYSYDAFEVYRSMGVKGGITRFPISFITTNVIARKGAFPDGFAQRSRAWFAGQTPRLMQKIQYYDNKVPEKYWVDIPASVQVGYFKLIRQMRLEFVQNEVYSPKMINLLKRLRCQQDPNGFECTVRGE